MSLQLFLRSHYKILNTNFCTETRQHLSSGRRHSRKGGVLPTCGGLHTKVQHTNQNLLSLKRESVAWRKRLITLACQRKVALAYYLHCLRDWNKLRSTLNY